MAKRFLTDVDLDDGGTFTTIFQAQTASATRRISFPNLTGTAALVAGTSGQLTYNLNGANAGLAGSFVDAAGNVFFGNRWISRRNGAASAPAFLGLGTWFSGGDGTTTRPYWLIEPAGSSSSAWSTGGTGFGVNGPDGSRLLDAHNNGTPRWHVRSDGVVVSTQIAPAAVGSTATITAANIQGGIITSTTAAAVDMTLPSGTNMDGAFTSPFVGMAVQWSVINTGSNAATLLAGSSGHTIVGAAAVAAGTSGRFASRRTAATTWITYRIA